MSPKLIELHVSQLSITIDRSKTNRYSDSRKQEYHEKLECLLQKIKQNNFEQLNHNKLIEFKKIINFISLSFEFLDSSILTVIPHEIVYCLEKALNDWQLNDNYIIVTALSNKFNDYHFDRRLSLNQTIYDLIFENFGIQFNHKFIQISLPRYLAHDYLSNVVLYHELGHFIDQKYRISESIVSKMQFNYNFNQHKFDHEYNHVSEYFADIFAAQYIGDSSNKYLNYIAHKNKDCFTHPSTDRRIQMVNDFINKNHADPYLKEILYATNEITEGIELKNRFTLIDPSDLKSFIPPLFNNDAELHSIFKLGWDLWTTDIDSFKNRNLKYEEKYRIINNLIEKSISNHMVLENWNK